MLARQEDNRFARCLLCWRVAAVLSSASSAQSKSTWQLVKDIAFSNSCLSLNMYKCIARLGSQNTACHRAVTAVRCKTGKYLMSGSRNQYQCRATTQAPLRLCMHHEPPYRQPKLPRKGHVTQFLSHRQLHNDAVPWWTPHSCAYCPIESQPPLFRLNAPYWWW